MEGGNRPSFTNPQFSARFQAVITLRRRADISLALAQSSMRTCPFSVSRLASVLVFLVLTTNLFSASAGCGNGSPESITIYAAASLTDAFEIIADDFEAANPGIEIRLNFAGSQRLRSQLELGAEADVFASADEFQMALARESGLIAGDSRPLASAAMAVIVAEDSRIRRVNQIAAPGAKVVLAHESVPAGQYARQLLNGLSEADPDLGADFADRVLANVVSEETSVKVVEQKVALGQADAGIVYRPGALTATATGAARELPLPASLLEEETGGVRASYPIAVLRDAPSPELAGRFVEFVLSRPAQEILSGHGFEAP